MANVYVENADRVQTSLLSFSAEVALRLKVRMVEIARRIAGREQAGLAPHTKTGRMAASVKTRVQSWVGIKGAPDSVSAVVSVGGRRAPYAHLFERGFIGSESVRAYNRGVTAGPRRFGKSGGQYGPVAPVMFIGPVRRGRARGPFGVRAYERKVSHHAHLVLNAAKEAERANTSSAIADAIGQTVDDLELR